MIGGRSFERRITLLAVGVSSLRGLTLALGLLLSILLLNLRGLLLISPATTG
jgi:hypothetical protein